MIVITVSVNGVVDCIAVTSAIKNVSYIKDNFQRFMFVLQSGI